MARAGGKTRRVHLIDDPATRLSAYPGTLRQLAITGLGHDEPTILITNQHTTPAKQIIETYSRRMNIEQRLAEAIRSFGLDALAGAVPLNIDLDVVLSVLAHTVCAAGYPATPPPPRTPCNAGSCPPAAPSSTGTTRSSSVSTAAPTHPSCDRPTSPTPPSPGSADAPSATSTPETGVQFAA